MEVLTAAAMVVGGLRLLSLALGSAAGSATHRWLQRASTPRAALAVGVLLTAALQSSSATTLVVLSAADAGWLAEGAAAAAVLGANLGTALAAQALAWRWEGVIPALYLLAALALLGYPRVAWPVPGTLLGIGLTLDGLERLDQALAPLSAAAGRTAWEALAGHPFLAFAAGLVLTSAVDSSSATVALVQQAAQQGALPLADALKCMYGAELGTTTGTVLASLAMGLRARRLAAFHVLYNALSVTLFWPFTEALAARLGAAASPARAVAHAQLLVNLIPLALVWPVRHGLWAAACRCVPARRVR